MKRDVGSYRRGSALLSVLLLTTVMVMMTTGFLARWRRDFHFQTHTERAEMAYQAARSGVEYYRSRPLPVGDIEHIPFTEGAPAMVVLDPLTRFKVYGVDAVGAPVVISNSAGASFTVNDDVGTTVVSVGEVIDSSGNVVLSRRLVVREGIWGNHHEE